MKATKIISACAVLVALASCSNDHVISQPGAEDTPIHIQANVGAVTTKAASNIQESQFEENENIGIFLREHLKTGETSIKSYTLPLLGVTKKYSNDMMIDLSTTEYYPSNGHGVDCLAIYPMQFNTSNIDHNTTSFSVQDDQSSDVNYKASDLMFAYKKETKNADKLPIKLTFEHLLSKIIIVLKVDGSVDKSVLNEAYIELSGLKKTIGINVSDMTQVSGSASSESTDASVSLNTSILQDDATITFGKQTKSSSDDTQTEEAAVIIVPQNIPLNTEFIKVKLSNDNGSSFYTTYTYKVTDPAGLTFAEKTAYKYTITLKAGSISVQSVQITPWTHASDGSGDANLD